MVNRLLLSCVALCAVCSVARAAAVPALPLGTSGRWIVDSAGHRVKLACVNWFGAEEKDFVVGGLDRNTLDGISALVAQMGFNCVRLPWSVEMYAKNPVVNASLLSQNPSLVGKRALDIYDLVVESLADHGVMTLLDNHMSTADWCCSDDDKNGLWYTDEYLESAWLSAWKGMTLRYVKQPMVIGADLRNEPRSTVVKGTRKHPTWGGALETDWRAAAERGAATVHAVNPNLLIVVEGLNYARDLTGVYNNPLHIDRLVYSAHEYSWFHLPLVTYDELRAELGLNWGYIIKQNQTYTAPVLITEFGTCHTGSNCYSGWWQHCLRYLSEGGDFDWAYWALDGTQSTGTGRVLGDEETFGVLDLSWKVAADLVHLQSLQSIQQCKENCN